MSKKITTTYVDGKAETLESTFTLFHDESGNEGNLLNLYPEVKYQVLAGFGGAFTESTGYVLSQMDETSRAEILEAYFGEKGIHYSFCRSHMGSCDFSLDMYSATEDPANTDLKEFSLERDRKYLFPIIKQAQKVSAHPINLLLSPWSPPAFMKTNGIRNNGGKLKPEYAGLWAKMVSRYIQEYRKEGIHVAAVTVQNEPKAVQKWDSCIYTGEEEGKFVVDYLAPQLKADGLQDVDIFIWDHNKERAYERARDSFSVEGCEKDVAGVAFHWYSGDHFENLEILRKLYPDKKLYFTEGCVEYSRFEGSDQLGNAQRYAHQMLGNLNAGTEAIIDWNLVLDSKGGPNHVGNFCDAPIMCDIETKRYEKKLSFCYIGHFSRYILPGAVRIAVSRYSDDFEATAFQNPDGSIAVVILNRNTYTVPVTLRLNEQVCPLEVEPSSISTILL